MPPDIPEYYRHLTEKKPEAKPPASPVQPQERAPAAPPLPADPRRPAPPPVAAGSPVSPSVQTYQAHAFTLNLAEEWTDQTVFTLTGPVADDIQHNLTVTISNDLPEMSLVDFADLHTRTLEEQLKGCRLLLKEPTQLDNGMPAYHAVFVWWPSEEVRLYQEQFYVVHEGTGFILTASFSKKTRQTLGPEVERIMRSFQPRV